ncbi:hypothetical protein PanWU01x14_147600 [Parasponia andersonii]|uniref:Uncharacterized protein n=1 Tax=Parasponia andersonii TaxID=3476 RepID=A0A2P5CJE6_PARAD|nr:hypothetical protein PanWU01x14_147600 [Parasponia andersonii]
MVRYRQQKLDSLDDYKCLRKGARGDDVGGETAGHRGEKCMCVELREQKGPSSGVQASNPDAQSFQQFAQTIPVSNDKVS